MISALLGGDPAALTKEPESRERLVDAVKLGSVSPDTDLSTKQTAHRVLHKVLDTTPEEFLARSLEDGLSLAEQYFKRKYKSLSLEAARQATEEVVAQLRADPTAQ